MTKAQYTNSIKRLLEIYIPEWAAQQALEGKDVKIPVKKGKEFRRVFADPSGVLDIWARTDLTADTNLNLTTESFARFLQGCDRKVVGCKRLFNRRVVVCLGYRQDPPPSDDESDVPDEDDETGQDGKRGNAGGTDKAGESSRGSKSQAR